MDTEQKISELISALNDVLEKEDPVATVTWIKDYTSLTERWNYGTIEHIKEISSIFNAHGIVAGMHEEKQKQTYLVGENAKTWSEFIAGQLLFWDVHPRYFNFASERFLNIHNNKQGPKR